MNIPQPPPGQPPIDPRGAFAPVSPAGSPAPGSGVSGMGVPGVGGPPMPPFFPPPMFLPPPPRGGGLGRALFTTLMTTIFGLSLALNIYFIASSALFSADGNISRTVVVPGSSSQTIAAIQINGLIDGNQRDRFEKLIKAVEDDTSVKALVLEIDSPGGAVDASDEIYHRVLKFKQEKHLPVVISMGGLAASGGYYIACAGDKVLAERTTITGSIGVLMPQYDLSGLAAKYGVEDTSIHSTGATFKTAGSMLKPETPEERQYFLALIDDMFATFKSVVTTGRGKSLKQPIDEIAVGKAFTATEALKMGLIDTLGYAGDAYTQAATLAGIGSGFEVIRFEPTLSLLGSFGVKSNIAPSAGQSVTVNGVNIQLSDELIQSFLSRRPMYLYR